MIHVLATIRTAEGQKDAFLATFRKLAPLVRAEAGCIEYGPAVDMPTPISGVAPACDDAVTVVEKWENVAALQDHFAAPHMVQFREAAKDLVKEVEIRVLQPV
jgi:quinol monooxygenase YgiN